MRARLRDRLSGAGDESGTALVEFFWLGILLLVPITYAILFAFQVQRAVFAVTEATRSAGRAYVSTPNGDATIAGTRATTAASLTMTDHGLPFAATDLDVHCKSLNAFNNKVEDDTCFTADHWVSVSLTVYVPWPVLGSLGAHVPVQVKGQHDEVFDKYADYATSGP